MVNLIVHLVNTGVLLVKPKVMEQQLPEFVKLVLETDLQFQTVHVQVVLMKKPTHISVNHVHTDVINVHPMLIIVTVVLKTEKIYMIVLVHTDIGMMDLVLYAQFVILNVLHVKVHQIIVLNVVETELMSMLKLVPNVFVQNILMILMSVIVHLVTINVPLVSMETPVLLVPKTESTLIANAQMVIIILKDKLHVNNVLTNVPDVQVVLPPVPVVPKTEKVPTNVHVKLDIMLMAKIVSHVTINVRLVLMKTHV